jgi:hypothetical protein
MSIRIILFVTIFIAFTSFRTVDGFVRGRFVKMNRRRQSRKAARSDFARKCIYASEKFPIAGYTCPARPNWNFKYIYGADPDVELWTFQRYNCLPRDDLERPSTGFVVLFYMAVFVLVWIAFTEKLY